MLVSLRNNQRSLILLLGIALTAICLSFGEQPHYSWLLTVAQLIFVPAMVMMVVDFQTVGKIIIVGMMLAVTLLHWWTDGLYAVALACLYLLYTFYIAVKGVKRFLQRGFTNCAEFSIDMGLIYLAIGGFWFFAFTANINTGFSPLITWLTAIHFHYSACLLPLSVGLFGRLYNSSWYRIIVMILLAGPLIVAIGITFSIIIEIIAVILYILAIYGLFVLTFKTKLPLGQGILLRVSYGALCLTIIGSCLYVYSRLSGTYYVGIPEMLRFHGVMNGLFFGGIGVLAWAIAVPATNQRPFNFPVSQIRGKLRHEHQPHPGLVDALQDFVDTTKLHPVISDFYEQTTNYRLLATVQWKTWFKPFAFLYQGMSRLLQQLNLPFSNQQIEMTGRIVKVDEEQDSRQSPRAWIRTIKQQTVFVAIYSKHTSNQTTYMNIALPLPFSTMVGILYAYEEQGQLHLTSQQGEDAGIYLAIGKYVMQLPLQEHFRIAAVNDQTLTAVHKMTLFGIPFLHIDYHIQKNQQTRQGNSGHKEKVLIGTHQKE